MLSMLKDTRTVDKIVKALIYSNIWISLESVGIVLATMILADFPLHPVPLLIGFAVPFLVYNVDRFTDRDEDAENMPERTRFVRAYGLYFTAVSVLLYLTSLLIALNKNILTFGVILLPVVIGVTYSQLDIKNILFVKNAVVGLSWGAAPLMVGAYFSHIFSFEVLFMAAFITVSIFRSAMVYDIKDIAGDREEGVKTVPNTFGVTTTKHIAYGIDTLLIAIELSLMTLGYLSSAFLVLIPFHLYIVLYVWIVGRDSGEKFYNLVIDGEGVFLGILVVLMTALGG